MSGGWFNEKVSRFLWFLLLSVCVAAQPNRRQPAPEPPPPKTLQLDVVVTDAGGLPAPNLAVADFQLAVDGKPAIIDRFSYVHQSPRRVVLLVDDAGLSADSVERVRTALASFVDQQLQPDDEAAILRTRSGEGVLETITADRRLLHDAIARIQFDPSRSLPGKSRDEFLFAGVATLLRRTLAGLTAIPGRKAVVLICDSLPLVLQNADPFEPFASLAADSSAVFYIAASGDSSETADAGLWKLSASTGGLRLGGELSAGLARVLQDQAGYYLLGYREPDPAPGNPGVTVQAANTGVQVRWRNLPLGTGPADRDFRSRTPNQELASALNSPFVAGAIHLQATPVFGHSPTTGPMVTALVWMDVRDLTFTHQLNGQHKASGQVLAVAFDSTGMSAGQAGYNIALQLTGDEYQNLLHHGWVCQLELRLRNPGTYQVRAAARDDTSSRMGSASQLVEVPDFSSGQLMLSGVALRAKNSTTIDSGPARRIFAPGERLVYLYQILNPSSDVAKPVALEARLHLFRGAVEVFTGVAQTLPAIVSGDPRRRAVSGEVSLGEKLPPGHYYLQTVVTDRQSAKPRQAQQWIDFQVR
ncbi:conserved hypothetical protein [Candidatus Sulfopaludibacter sp. SbA3]|nr:conserved hypothetical protein [Candidatus Sulfopaludibacter sp. SbA3]